MSRLVTVLALGVVVCAAGVSSASAQGVSRNPSPAKISAAVATGELQGTVVDERDRPIAGAVVSAIGAMSAFAITNAAGVFGFGALPPGPYLVRAHVLGYTRARSELVQINSGSHTAHPIRLARIGSSQVLAAGVPGDTARPTGADEGEPTDDHSELAWRLRHLKRGALNDAEVGTSGGETDSLLGDSLSTIGRAMTTSARVATGVLADLPLSGQLNLLTSTSFDHPQQLFSNQGPPHGVAYLSLRAPARGGDWTMRGALTQGDLSSWVLAGSYVRRTHSTHAYEAGLSYTMQRYVGGNALALAAVPDGNRNAGSLYAYDHWHIVPAVTLTYGGRYARYDYLDAGGLLSPRVGVTVKASRHLRLRAAASRRQIAPGSEEFQPPSSIGVWLPPERTFSSLSPNNGFRPERVDHFEFAAEHDLRAGVVFGVRAFHQRVDDQLMTLFGVSLPRTAAADIGHYYVASAGGVSASGWGVSVSRAIVGRVRGSVDYTESRADWDNASPDREMLALVAPSFLRADRERLRDLTTSVDAELPLTATRMFVIYRLNTSAPVGDMAGFGPLTGGRFDVQVHQSLPFLNFTSAQWAMLVAVRNVFREDLLDASVYDELLVVRPPKRIVGGLTVRF